MVLPLVLARLLAPLDFCLVVMAMAVVSFTWWAQDLRLGQALIQQRRPLSDTEKSTAFWANVGAGCLLFAALAAGFVWGGGVGAVLNVAATLELSGAGLVVLFRSVGLPLGFLAGGAAAYCLRAPGERRTGGVPASAAGVVDPRGRLALQALAGCTACGTLGLVLERLLRQVHSRPFAEAVRLVPEGL